MKHIQVSDLKLTEILNRIPFFTKFSVEERKAFFTRNLEFLRCRPGELIIKEGEAQNGFFIVLSGRASVYLNNGLDKVAEVQGGYFIGEGAFINNSPHSASIKADIETYVLRLDRESLNRFPASIREKVKDQIIAGMAMRLRDMNIRWLLKEQTG